MRTLARTAISYRWFVVGGWPAFIVLGWSLFGWATLRSPNGAPLFFLVLLLFLLVNVIIPAFRGVLNVPPRSGPLPDTAGAPVPVALLIGG